MAILLQTVQVKDEPIIGLDAVSKAIQILFKNADIRDLSVLRKSIFICKKVKCNIINLNFENGVTPHLPSFLSNFFKSSLPLQLILLK